METVTDFIFLGSKITRDCDYSQEIKRHLLLGTKALTNLDNIWKSKDISLPKKVHIASNSYDFSSSHVQMSEWTIKKAEHWRIDAVMLEKTLESPLDCRRANQSVLKEMNPEYSLNGLLLKQKLQYIGHLMWRADSLENTLMLGTIECGRGWDG